MTQNNQVSTNVIQMDLSTQNGVQQGVENIITKNASLMPENANTKRIINSAGFYIASCKHSDSLLKMNKEGKLQMLYGVLKEAMVGGEAGTDYDIITFKGKPTIMRKKEGWFKIIDMIKPGEIIRFTSGVFNIEDDIKFNPVTEELYGNFEDLLPVVTFADVGRSFAHIEFSTGFKMTVSMSREQMEQLKSKSPSGKSDFSPWNAFPSKMVETKITKELAKKLFTLFSKNLESHFKQAIMSDENYVESIDENGNVKTNNSIYNEPQAPVQQERVIIDQSEVSVTPTSLDDL